VWFDVHVWTDGPNVDPSLTAKFSYDNALGQIANGANYKVVVFELNAQNHSQGRALGNALAINSGNTMGICRLSSRPIISSRMARTTRLEPGITFSQPVQCLASAATFFHFPH
jgi:hypothetical protein